MKNTKLTEPMKAALKEMRRYQPMSPATCFMRDIGPSTLRALVKRGLVRSDSYIRSDSLAVRHLYELTPEGARIA